MVKGGSGKSDDWKDILYIQFHYTCCRLFPTCRLVQVKFSKADWRTMNQDKYMNTYVS